MLFSTVPGHFVVISDLAHEQFSRKWRPENKNHCSRPFPLKKNPLVKHTWQTMCNIAANIHSFWSFSLNVSNFFQILMCFILELSTTPLFQCKSHTAVKAQWTIREKTFMYHFWGNTDGNLGADKQIGTMRSTGKIFSIELCKWVVLCRNFDMLFQFFSVCKWGFNVLS